MKKEDIPLLAQLMRSMRDAAKELDSALGDKDVERVNELKKQILSFQQKINQII